METKRQSPIALLLTMFMLFLLSNGVAAQLDKSKADSLLAALDLAERERIEALITYGPHYKNPNAAGRLGIISRTTPAAVKSTRVQPMGPAYKNRRAIIVPAQTFRTTETRPRLTGPRYKNRGAKTSKD